jgi:hypothetical protein
MIMYASDCLCDRARVCAAGLYGQGVRQFLLAASSSFEKKQFKHAIAMLIDAEAAVGNYSADLSSRQSAVELEHELLR